MNFISRAVFRFGVNNVNSSKVLKSSILSFHRHYLSTSENVEKVKKKTIPIPQITLIRDEQLSITTLEEAQKLSKRRNLKLVKIVDLDTKTQRPVYKLMTASQYQSDDLKEKELHKANKQNNIKGEKVLLISQNISDHDLKTRINKINKWVEKFHEVRIVINGNESNMEKAETLYNTLEKAVGLNGRIVQKRQKGSDIRFQILPPKKNKDDNTS